MSKRAPRAPAGAVAVAASVRALVRDVGAKAAAQVMGVSAGRAAAMARAAERGRIGGIVHTPKGLSAWKERIDKAASHAPKGIREVIKRDRAPEQHERAKTKAGRQHQTEAGMVRAQYSDKAIGKAAGISRQKATAIRLQLAAGKEPKEKDRAAFDKGVERLITRHGVRDGILVISQEKAAAILAKMTPAERAAHSADKKFTNWQDAKNWADGVAGAPAAMVKVYNSGTASAPMYSMVISYEDTDDGYYDDADDWDLGDDLEEMDDDE